MASTTISKLTAVPGQSALVPVTVPHAHEPGVYRLDTATRITMVPR